MRRKNILYSFIVILFILVAGCSNNEDDVDETENTEMTSDVEEVENEEENETIDVDRGLTNVEITLPSSFVGTEDEADQIISQSTEEDGISDITKNDDGSLTYKMSPEKHNEMMEEIEGQIHTTIQEIVEDEELSSIEDITANDSFSEFTLLVDQVAFENSFDGFATMALGMSGLLYQAFDGVSPDDYNVLIHLEDTNSGEVFSTIEYPEVLEEMEEINEVEE